MDNTILILFIAGFGFIASAVLSLAGGIMNGEGRYRISFSSVPAIIGSFAVCMFTGPYMTAENSLNFWREGSLPGKYLMLALFISLIWSFCSGVFVIQLFHVLGIV